jgi:hypothetical protein
MTLVNMLSGGQKYVSWLKITLDSSSLVALYLFIVTCVYNMSQTPGPPGLYCTREKLDKEDILTYGFTCQRFLSAFFFLLFSNHLQSEKSSKFPLVNFFLD